MTKQEIDILVDSVKSAQQRGVTNPQKIVDEIKISFGNMFSSDDIIKVINNDTQITSKSIDDLFISFKKKAEDTVKQEKVNNDLMKSFSEKLSEDISNNYDSMGFYLSGIMDSAEDDLAFRKGIASIILDTPAFSNTGMEVGDVMNIVNSQMDRLVTQNASFMEQIHHSTVRFFESDAGQYLQNGMQNAMGTIKGHIDGILGETKTLILDPIMNIGSTAFDMLMSTEIPEGDQMTHNFLDRINDRLDDMVGISKDDKLRKLREDKGEGLFGGIFDDLSMFGMILTGVGLTLGGLVGAIIKPFQVLQSMTKIMTPFISMMKSLGNLKFIKPIMSLFGKGGQILTSIKFLQPLFIGFAQGFTKLAWPINILLGAIDFFKGFIGSSETSFLGKLIDGIKSAFLGFFDLPIRLFGWVADKILGLFGKEIEGGVGGQIIKGISGLFDNVLKPFGSFISFIIEKTVVALKVYGGFLIDGLKVIGNIFGIFKNLLMFDSEALAANFSNIGSLIDGMFTKLFDGIAEFFGVEVILADVKMAFQGFIDTLTSIPGILSKYLTDKLSNIPGIGRFFKEKEPEKMATGGMVTSDGLAYLHANEIVAPASEIIPAIQGNAVSGVIKEIQNIKSINRNNQIKHQTDMIRSINTNNNTIKGSMDRQNSQINNIVSTSINQQQSQQEIPDSIESVQLLLLNSSWGIS